MTQIGTEIDGFRITGVLGRGGMGIVYEAEDVALGRTVALKMIEPVFARDEQFLRRFQSEARALARINEPHIVQVHALRHASEGSFIVMECVDGGTLGDRMASGPVPVSEAVPLIRQMLQAFAHAHDLGVVHRDIKPGNIMLSRGGMVKVTDFGLARVLQSQPTVTVTQAAAGTLYYMSPEQVKGSATIDHRSDLYSLGMTIYEMLAGRLPFERQLGDFETMRIIVEEEYPPPSRFNAAIPAAISRVVMKALEKDPKRRYQHAREMLADLDAVAVRVPDDTATVVLERPPASALGSGRRRHVTFAALGIALILVVGTILWFLRNPEGGLEASSPGPVAPAAAILDVVSTPEGASMTVDGRAVGITPLSADVVPSEQGVRLRLERDGFESLDTVLIPISGETLAVNLTLRESTAGQNAAGGAAEAGTALASGTVSLNLVGDGVARIGGRAFRGSTRVILPPGRHELQCGDAPFDLTTRIQIESGRERSITCHFERRIMLNTQMDDGGLAPSASIWIDGQDTGLFTPREIVRGPGRYTITVRKFGYDVLNQEELTIRPSLEPPAPHRLVFRLRQTT